MLSNVTNQLKQIQEIDGYITKVGGAYSQWYVGIASEARTRLFNEHNVDEKNGYWIYRKCGSSTAAWQGEEYFLAKGCKGGTGGGDYTTQYLYAYKITQYTRE